MRVLLLGSICFLTYQETLVICVIWWTQQLSCGLASLHFASRSPPEISISISQSKMTAVPFDCRGKASLTALVYRTVCFLAYQETLITCVTEFFTSNLFPKCPITMDRSFGCMVG